MGKAQGFTIKRRTLFSCSMHITQQRFCCTDILSSHNGNVIGNVMGSFGINQTLGHGITQTEAGSVYLTKIQVQALDWFYEQTGAFNL